MRSSRSSHKTKAKNAALPAKTTQKSSSTTQMEISPSRLVQLSAWLAMLVWTAQMQFASTFLFVSLCYAALRHCGERRRRRIDRLIEAEIHSQIRKTRAHGCTCASEPNPKMTDAVKNNKNEDHQICFCGVRRPRTPVPAEARCHCSPQQCQQRWSKQPDRSVFTALGLTRDKRRDDELELVHGCSLIHVSDDGTMAALLRHSREQRQAMHDRVAREDFEATVRRLATKLPEENINFDHSNLENSDMRDDTVAGASFFVRSFLQDMNTTQSRSTVLPCLQRAVSARVWDPPPPPA
ncbi:MAG: hypothetical protein MHM6MM_000859 [Cercozoa sp. M6MM]